MAKFVIRHGGSVVGEYPLLKPVVTIGRKADNDLRVDNLSVSNHHARVVKDGDRFVIEDDGSTNGTFVRNKRIRRHQLANGDEIQLGKHTLVFVAEVMRPEMTDQATVLMARPSPTPPPVPPETVRMPVEEQTNATKLVIATVVITLIVVALGAWLMDLF